ncbi:hypothetical protein FFZ99_11985 [Leptospira interrogans]|nr:hypothetical protein B2G47_02925 [Leptospira interrogans serovar Canicola]OMH68168.1 hypothetical protein BW243_07010 [Leptospira interrogans serovar Pomona]TQE56927.1 hypothetical protein FF006_11995 [Leptospira interrogans]ASV08456.1 hypothetical protein B2G50_04175 [Leptospira interrogans serovar Canicola]OLZ32018.1 hypothetical protein AR546_08105 [Leptospira interrogans serovar Canicola]
MVWKSILIPNDCISLSFVPTDPEKMEICVKSSIWEFAEFKRKSIKGTEFNPMESVYKFRRRFLNLLHFELSLRDSVILSILVYGQLY